MSKKIEIAIAGPIHSGRTIVAAVISEALKQAFPGKDISVNCPDGDFEAKRDHWLQHFDISVDAPYLFDSIEIRDDAQVVNSAADVLAKAEKLPHQLGDGFLIRRELALEIVSELTSRSTHCNLSPESMREFLLACRMSRSELLAEDCAAVLAAAEKLAEIKNAATQPPTPPPLQYTKSWGGGC